MFWGFRRIIGGYYGHSDLAVALWQEAYGGVRKLGESGVLRMLETIIEYMMLEVETVAPGGLNAYSDAVAACRACRWYTAIAWLHERKYLWQAKQTPVIERMALWTEWRTTVHEEDWEGYKERARAIIKAPPAYVEESHAIE